MKKILTTTFFLLLIVSKMTAQKWVASPGSAGLLPNYYTIYGIKVVNKDVIWAVATYELVPRPATQPIKFLLTTNGGLTWRVTNVPIAIGRSSYDIEAFDSGTAWISTNSNTLGTGLLKTTDGGQTWVQKLTDKAGGASVRFFDRNNGVCIGYDHRFAYTSDGGENWTIDSTSIPMIGTEKPAFYLAGTNNFIRKGDTIWFGTTSGRVMRSINKGRNWTPNSTGIPSNWAVATLAFQDARNGMLVGMDTTVYTYKGIANTNDGGLTWQIVPQSALSSTFKWFPSLTAIPNENQKTYLLGLENQLSTSGASVITLDDGNTWLGLEKDIHSHGASEFLSPQIGWIGNGFVNNATNSATMFKWDGGEVFTAIKVLEAEDIALKISPNPTSRFLTVEYAADFKPISLHIYDAMGKLVLAQKNLPISSQVVDLQSFTNGVYLVQLQNTEGVITKKIVVQH